MKHHVLSLITILQDHQNLHQELLALLEDEAENMGTLSGAELLRLHSDKMRVSRKIQNLESQRIAVVQQLAEQWEEDDLPLRRIIEQAPQDQATELQQCFDQLTQTIQEIQKKSEHNSRLSKVRLKSVESSLKFLVDLQKQQQTYSDSGTLQKPSTLQRTSI